METIINKVQLSGFIGKDPEIKKTTSGMLLARFSLGTLGYYTKEGKVESKVDWHSLVAWGEMADKVETDLKKGIKCAIVGKLAERNYRDLEGKTRYVTEGLAQDQTL